MGERHCLWGLLCTLALLLWDSSDVTKAFSLTPGPASRAAPRAPRALRAELRPRPAEERLQLFSPAKVNLFLRIIRKREDGYHDLASLFHTVAFGDSLQLEVLPEDAKKDKLECNLPGVPVDESNLVIRALKLFREKSGIQRFFDVKLEKKIPAQAGMGGGSSNAATAFYGANVLCGSPATPEDSIKWGDDPVIGSDATFFLSEGTAYCTGRGEIVTPIDGLPIKEGLSVFLVKPNYGLSTGKVFKAMDYSALSKVDPEELLQTFKDKGTSHSFWVNDLESPAFTVSPELSELKDYLNGCGFEAVLMSGSGSTIFCLGEPGSGADIFEASTRRSLTSRGFGKRDSCVVLVPASGTRRFDHRGRSKLNGGRIDLVHFKIYCSCDVRHLGANGNGKMGMRKFKSKIIQQHPQVIYEVSYS